MVKRLNWQLISNGERNKVIERIKKLISSHDGYITNFQLYSDLALVLVIEIEERHIKTLHSDLQREVVLSELHESLLHENSEREWTILMNISFGKGTGQLKIEVPAVPG